MSDSDNDHYLLHLKDFESNISKGWKDLRNDVDFCDVTLACDDNQIKVHKVIVSTCSPVLKNLLKKNPHQHPLLYMRGVKFTELVNIVDFMYNGEIKIPRDEINALLNVAKDLQVVGLSDSDEDLVVDLGEANDIAKNVQKTKRIMEESDEDTPTFEGNGGNQSDVDLNQYIHKYGYQSTNDNSEQKVRKQETEQKDDAKQQDDTEELNQTIEDYNEDQLENISVFKSESPMIYNTTQEKEDGKSHTEEVNSNLACEQCNTKFMQPVSLYRHIKSVHEGIRFSCGQCDYTATQTGALNRHIKSVHDKIRYSCNFCDYSATQKALLNKHLKVKH